MYYLISLIWNWFPSIWLWERHLKNILRFNLSLTFYKRKLISIHKQHGLPNPFLKASAPRSVHVLCWFSPVTRHAVQQEGKNCFTEVDGMGEPALLTESRREQQEGSTALTCHLVALKMLHPRAPRRAQSSAAGARKENSQWGRTGVWKSHGFNWNNSIFTPTELQHKHVTAVTGQKALARGPDYGLGCWSYMKLTFLGMKSLNRGIPPTPNFC